MDQKEEINTNIELNPSSNVSEKCNFRRLFKTPQFYIGIALGTFIVFSLRLHSFFY